MSKNPVLLTDTLTSPPLRYDAPKEKTQRPQKKKKGQYPKSSPILTLLYEAPRKDYFFKPSLLRTRSVASIPAEPT